MNVCTGECEPVPKKKPRTGATNKDADALRLALLEQLGGGEAATEAQVGED